MQSFKLSVITINRNNAEGLRKTMQSVLDQTSNDFEYIIIDGASTDGSVAVIKEFLENHKNASKITYWVSELDTGIYNAMNKGVEKASGTYLHILNSGDYYYGNALQNIIPELQSEKYDFVLAAVTLVTDREYESIEIRCPKRLEFGSMSHQGIFYKKELHRKYGLYDEHYKYASDYDFSMKAFYKNKRFSFVTVPTTFFFTGGLGVSEDSINEIKEIRKKYGLVKNQIKFNSNLSLHLKRIIKFAIAFFSGMLITHIVMTSGGGVLNSKYPRVPRHKYPKKRKVS